MRRKLHQTFLAAFVVTWATSQKIVPCPNAVAMNGGAGEVIAPACIEQKSGSKEFKNKDQAQGFAQALKEVGAQNVKLEKK